MMANNESMVAGRHDVGSLSKTGRHHSLHGTTSQASSLRSQRSARLNGYASAT